MGLLSRNVAIVMALLVALHATHAAPANKDGDGKGGKKGRRSVQEDVAVDGVSSFEGAFVDALAEDAEAAQVLEEQVRARRSLSAVEGEEPAGAYVEGEASADGAALQAEGEEQSPLKKKPCRGNRGGEGTDTETTGEAEEMQRQSQRKNKKKKARNSSTTESSALVSWLMSDD